MSSVDFGENDYRLNETSSVTAKRTIMGKGAEDLTMDDFFNLFVAQMTNQDMLNPQDNTEFVAQMAQFTSLQGIKQIQEYQLSSYAVSYVGKDVTVAVINEYTGEMEKITGTVEGVNFYNGSPQVVVKGKNYPLYTIMEVGATGSSSSSSDPLAEASKYVGQTVSIIHENALGIPEIIIGKVTNALIEDGKPYVIVNGGQYPVNEISVIHDADHYNAQSEANQYVGKTVRIEQEDEDGNTVELIGEVTAAKVIDGKPYVVIGGKEYPVSKIQSVLSNEDAARIKETEELKAKYLNQDVRVHYVDEDGNDLSFSGKVTGISYYNEQFYATVDGKDYPVSSIN